MDPPSTLNAAILLAGGSGVVQALCLRLIGGRDILTVRSFLFGYSYIPELMSQYIKEWSFGIYPFSFLYFVLGAGGGGCP